ncbi:hypothetical protein FHG68_04350 [Leptospira weilii]|nr:hypothetical protein FHG67_04490 [Leptospira weilii]QDK26021.1 hypothetical protein FHG68_04350 [Leptospira weilii]
MKHRVNAYAFVIPNSSYSSLQNRVFKILRLNAGFVLKWTVFYFIGISNKDSSSQNFTKFKIHIGCNFPNILIVSANRNTVF